MRHSFPQLCDANTFARRTSDSSISVEYGLQMKRKETEDGPKKRGGNRKKTKQDTSDEEDDCAAENCLRPGGKDDVVVYNIPSVALTISSPTVLTAVFAQEREKDTS